jgi:hypothetical protein
MSVTVFTWDMFKFGRYLGVGHAALYVNNSHYGDIYISFWPAKHSLSAAAWSVGKVHFMAGDKDEDGMPGWASKPLANLDERKIIDYWGNFDPNHNLKYKGAASYHVTHTNQGGKHYDILLSQCSTTVVQALLSGADTNTRMKINSWLRRNMGSNFDFGGFKGLRIPNFSIPTMTPADVREMVCDVWGDSYQDTMGNMLLRKIGERL